MHKLNLIFVNIWHLTALHVQRWTRRCWWYTTSSQWMPSTTQIPTFRQTPVTRELIAWRLVCSVGWWFVRRLCLPRVLQIYDVPFVADRCHPSASNRARMLRIFYVVSSEKCQAGCMPFIHTGIENLRMHTCMHVDKCVLTWQCNISCRRDEL